MKRKQFNFFQYCSKYCLIIFLMSFKTKNFKKNEPNYIQHIIFINLIMKKQLFIQNKNNRCKINFQNIENLFEFFSMIFYV